jgi:S-adenosylmethionine-diacylgycerolhomoserine-N-methlytransferase
MSLLDTLKKDAAVLKRLVRGMPSYTSQTERLQAFYAPQAERYDAFRERLLAGRADLIRMLAPAPGEYVVELGAGTGRTIEYMGVALERLRRVELVDLCPALLDRARARIRNMPNVEAIHADATLYRPAEPVDCVYLSYALTMIPDWRSAIDNALHMLRPGGRLGIVDFYVSSAQPGPGLARHHAALRMLCRAWFEHDGVRLDPGHLATLQRALPDHRLIEGTAPLPYVPGLRVPYYLFVGRKSAA